MPLLGHARIDENGNVMYGQAGDQNGQELMYEDFGDNKWGFTKVFRVRDIDMAERIGDGVLQACRNDNIGYSQSDRYSMQTEMEKAGSIYGIKNKCNCDCSSLVRNACTIAGVRHQSGAQLSKYMRTYTQRDELMNTGLFEELVWKSGMKLYKGDILWKNGHTGTIVDSEYKRATDPSEAFKWYGMATTTLNVRKKPDSSTADTLYIPRRYVQANEIVEVCDDTHTAGWYYCRIKNEYYAWLSAKYIAKTTKVPDYAKIGVGSKVEFTGTKVYASSYKNGKGVSAEKCIGVITRDDGNFHKYHFKSDSGVEGWVDATDVKIVK